MNVERYKQVLAHIKAHPEEWDQENWEGVPCCFAGHAQRFSEAAGNRACFTTRQVAKWWLKVSSNDADWLFNRERTIKDFEQFLASMEAGVLENYVGGGLL